jgi:branched-chain amino acid transport system ATP-binding protein
MLTISNLRAGYGKLVVIDNLSLEIKPEQFTAILGPNGSGKSTLLKSVFGLTTILGGSVRLDAQEVIGLPTEVISQHGIAYVPQRNNIFATMTVQDNLLIAARQLTGKQSQQAFAETYDMFPILGKRRRQVAASLSGGERQMLAIALGWLTRPRVMLLDEPTAGLSPLFTTEVFRTLQQLVIHGMTLVVVEQNARSVLRWCDHVYILRSGQLVYDGTAQESLRNEAVVKEYLGVGTYT